MKTETTHYFETTRDVADLLVADRGATVQWVNGIATSITSGGIKYHRDPHAWAAVHDHEMVEVFRARLWDAMDEMEKMKEKAKC